jgi:hypothetical protein
VDSSAVANPAIAADDRMTWLATASALVLLAAAPLGDVSVESYRASAAGGRAGSLSGQVYLERPRPRESDQPLAGTSISLLPRSQALFRRLAEIRQGARGSLDAFHRAAAEIEQEQAAFERTLWESGAADLVLRTSTGKDGLFELADVPEGDWLLLAWYRAPVDRRAAGMTRHERKLFGQRERVAGYYAVSIWLREVRVGPAERLKLSLSDRSVWLDAVIEDRVLDTGR